MKRDYDIIRQILIDAEEAAPGESISVSIEGKDQLVVNHHIMLLIDAGYLTGASVGRGVRAIIHDVTWEGHDLLDAMRDESIWNKAKESLLKPAGNVTIEVLLAWLKWQLMQKFGIPS